MSTTVKVALGAFVLMFIVAFSVTASGFSIYNDCTRQENGLEAQYKQNQSNYDALYKKVTETAGVADKYAGDLRKAYDGAMKDRYGDGGSKAVISAITEQNPNLDANVYKQIQQVIEAGRDSFSADQKTLLDKKRTYENTLKTIPVGLFAKVMGFPKTNLAQYDIVSSDRTKKAFENKKDQPFDMSK